jgi:hypothetical protein
MKNDIVNVRGGETTNGATQPFGTPKALTPDIAKRICERAAKGIEIGLACEAEGIDEALFRRRVIEDKCGEFRGVYARARVAFEEGLIGLIDKDARGAQFILERKLGWTKDPDSRIPKEESQDQSKQCLIPPDRLPELYRMGREILEREGAA